jgi:hypothetical protein
MNRTSYLWVSAFSLLLLTMVTVAGGVLAAQVAGAATSGHTSDPDCVSSTLPQNSATVEICATASGLTFAYANEPPVQSEGVGFDYVSTQQNWSALVSMPTSGSQCALNTAPDITSPAQSSCNFSVSLPDGQYAGAATLSYRQQTQVRFDLEVDPADQPLPMLPTTTVIPTSGGCFGSVDLFSVSGLAASYAGTRGSTDGYWKASTDGGVSACGGAVEHGSMSGEALDQPITGIVSTTDGGGYWLVAKDGGIFSFGDAQFYGSMGGKPLNKPVVSIAPTADNGGYWMVASDGGIFAFGDAQFYGSMGGKPLNKPIVGIAATPDGGGYWMVASDGGIFNFGDAGFYGSMGGTPLNKSVVGVVPSTDGNGYFLVASDGGVFAFGDAVFSGSTGGNPPNTPVVGVVANSNGGYWLITSGALWAQTISDTVAFGGAPDFG